MVRAAGELQVEGRRAAAPCGGGTGAGTVVEEAVGISEGRSPQCPLLVVAVASGEVGGGGEQQGADYLDRDAVLELGPPLDLAGRRGVGGDSRLRFPAAVRREVQPDALAGADERLAALGQLVQAPPFEAVGLVGEVVLGAGDGGAVAGQEGSLIGAGTGVLFLGYDGAASAAVSLASARRCWAMS
ncbi:hypothetical protein ASE03_12295 [Kitasatospora sp. Root187]|nr:hypothetical protein ASE03_12295 [Kitasatospora sp. Root187]